MIDLVKLAVNPIPTGARTGMFSGYDGTQLRYALWERTQGQSRGTACVFTGQSEHIERYFEVVADLRRRGFAVAIMDWRGHGGSERGLANRRKCQVTDFAEYDKDLACFMQQVVLPDCAPPYLALAHSMGGHILLRNAALPSTWFERMILSAPMIRIHPEQLKVWPWVVRLYVELAVLFGAGHQFAPGSGTWAPEAAQFERNVLTSDRERFARNRAIVVAEPDLIVAGVTNAWLRAALRSSELINQPSFAAKINVPILFFIAGQDKVVLPQAIEDFSSRLKVGTHVILANAKHEILQETDDIRGRFWATFDAYMGVGTDA